ncbi:MAG: cbb3-type cytochrome c oxidase subunit I [Ilumatobacteraceae bacterium]
MTTIETHPDDSVAATTAGDSTVPSFITGVGDWVTTTDHKKIGRLSTGFGLLVLLAAAVLALLLDIERLGDPGSFIDTGAQLQLIQMYRIGLVVGGIAPLALGLAVAAVPMQLGARQIAFPRVALAGFYTWLGGTALVYVSLALNGGAGGGDADMVDLFLTGLGLAVLGLCATAMSLGTTVLTTRAPGMTMRRVPVFAWSSLIGAIATVLVMPVLVGVLIYLYVDHRLGSQANFMGVEGIGAWIGWAFTVPTVVIFAIPAVGFAAEQFAVAFKSRQPMRGFLFAGIALIGVTAYAGATQQFVHDVTFDASGETFIRGAVPFLMFAGLPLLGVLLVLMLVLLTAKDGAKRGPSVRAPFVFGFLGLLLVAVGIAANFVQGITDLELIDPLTNTATTFEEGATLFVVYGAALAMLGGLVYWAPKFRGSLIPDKQVLPLALLGALGTLLAGGALLVAGFLDQIGGFPASQAEVDQIMTAADDADIWITLSLIGQGLVALTLLAFGGLLLKPAGDTDDDTDDLNPYGGQTIEWSAASPAPAYNFEHVATVASAEPLFDTDSEGSSS